MVRNRPRVLAGGGLRSQAVSLFRQAYETPIIVAPTAPAGLVWCRGEVQLARAASESGVPFCAATEAIATVEKIAVASTGQTWFQLYLWEKEELTRDLTQRAWDKRCASIGRNS